MSAKPFTVLVVDDSDDIIEVLELALTGSGHRVLVAHDAVRAFELVRAERPAVLLTDIMLGVTSGLDLITRVRSDLAPPLPAIIAMSGFGDVAGEALQRGAARFLPKPFLLEDLLEAVATAAAGRAASVVAVRRAAHEARRGRAEAAAAASAALARMGPRHDELLRRMRWTVEWLPGYLGFGHAFVAILQDGRLRAIAASADAPVTVDAAVGDEFPLVRDIAETASSVVLPGNNGGAGGRFFAGVPLRVGALAVGAFCVVDDQPRALAADDFEVMQSFGRRASKVLADGGTDMVGALWAASGLLARDAFSVLLSALLRRCQNSGAAFHVLSFACAEAPRGWRDALATLLGHDHAVIADFGGRRYGAIVAGEPRLDAGLTAWATGCGAAVGLVSVDATLVRALAETEVTRFAEAALERALARRDDGGEPVERFTVGRAAPFAEEGTAEP